ncbi:hypothetical protein [Aquipuribacter nitratireducens]|uniref:Uncharacterized protein n=1 Tax=Aquipuribacter nitratireducens TaxID=650104 RepID=A0ABW0GN58_9MICO
MIRPGFRRWHGTWDELAEIRSRSDRVTEYFTNQSLRLSITRALAMGAGGTVAMLGVLAAALFLLYPPSDPEGRPSVDIPFGPDGGALLVIAVLIPVGLLPYLWVHRAIGRWFVRRYGVPEPPDFWDEAETWTQEEWDGYVAPLSADDDPAPEHPAVRHH